MALRYAIASGNWSNPATWDGGLTVPGSGDTVRPNGFNVTIDQNINVTTLTNNASAPAVGGGSFYANDGIEITGSVESRFASGVTLYVTGSNSCIVVGNIIHGSNTSNGTAILMQNSANLIVSGTLTVSTSTQSNNNALLNAGSGILRVTGSIGNIVGGVNQFGITNSSNGTVYFIGTINNSGTSGRRGIRNTLNGSVYFTGSLIGNSISNESVGNIYVSGSVTALSTITDAVITSTTNGLIYVNGPISSSISANGVASTSTTATNLFSGPFYNTGSFNAVYAYRMQIIDPASTSWRFDTETAGGSKTLYTSNQLPGVPRQNNVRKGVQYNFGLTGSLEMPDPTTVKSGVPVDNTTGSAILTAQDMFDVLTQDITQTGSIGETLDNVSTVQTVAATVSAFKV